MKGLPLIIFYNSFYSLFIKSLSWILIFSEEFIETSFKFLFFVLKNSLFKFSSMISFNAWDVWGKLFLIFMGSEVKGV